MSANVSNSTIKLSTGQLMPIVGLGTWQSPKGEVKRAVYSAIKSGYRHLDCAYVYQNEDEIGDAISEAISEGLITRQDLFITSKVWLTFYSQERVELCLKRTLEKLKTDYLDLYLVHWPFGFEDDDNEILPVGADGLVKQNLKVDFTETWKGMEGVFNKGLVKAIGISNFTIPQIEKLLKVATIKPVMNQIESHPFLTETELVNYCRGQGMAITAYSPLGSSPPASGGAGERPSLREHATVKEIAEKHNKSTAQVLIRFAIERGIVVIPKSVTPERIEANGNVFDFELSKEELAKLEGLNCGFRFARFNILGIDTHRDYPFKSEA